MADPSSRPDIQHVVVLMLENRSFDCMFGNLYVGRDDFDGLTNTESNVWHKSDGATEVIPVWTDSSLGAAGIYVPTPDPGESFVDIGEQISGTYATPPEFPPGTPMGGFVDNYARQAADGQPRDPNAVMHYFTPRNVPVISELAMRFGVSDRWHASAPCQTWPNRLFAHAGTAGGRVDNRPLSVPFTMDTVFDRLSEAKRTWRIYFHDFSQTLTLGNLWLKSSHYRRLGESFVADAAAGDLPNYSFLEPRYFADVIGNRMPNDQHPPHDVAYGEDLIATVYNALRDGPAWRQTLLIVTCDEHGGCFDHVVPPPATPPGGPTPDGFAFDRFGVRVPAVIVSPLITPGSIIRPSGATPYDHTSIYKTLQELFGLRSLTPRSDAAPSLLEHLSANEPNDGPDQVKSGAMDPLPAEVAELASREQNGLQQSYTAAASRLPSKDADIPMHLEALAAEGAAPLVHPTVQQAAVHVNERMRAFLGEGEFAPMAASPSGAPPGGPNP